MKSFRDRNPVAVGVVSVLVLGVLVMFAFAVGILRLFEDAYPARAVFRDASGIHAGDDVMVAGVKVGRVDSVSADRENGTVVVEFVVNRGVDLGRDTTAEIALKTLLGQKFLRLDGPVERPHLAELPEAERVIPVERTKTPFDVFELTKVGTESIQATDTEKLNRLISQLADISADKHDQIGQLATGVTEVSAAITEREAQLRELLDRAEQLSATLAEKDETLVALIDQSQAVLDLVSRRRGDIARAIDDGTATVEQVAGIVSAHKTQLDLILDTLHPTVDILDRRRDDIDRTLSWVGTGALGLAKASGKGPWQDIYIRSLGPDVITLLESMAPEAAGAP